MDQSDLIACSHVAYCSALHKKIILANFTALEGQVIQLCRLNYNDLMYIQSRHMYSNPHCPQVSCSCH